MALRDSYTTQSGIVLAEAYLRVEDNSVAVTHARMTFAVMAYASAEAPAAGSPPVEAGRFYNAPYDMAGANPFDQAYAWLKTGTPEQGVAASEDYAPAFGEPGDPDYVAQVGTPASEDWVAAVPPPYPGASDV